MCVLAVALASCSRDDIPNEPVPPIPPDPGKEDLVEIRLNSAVNPLEANTKAPFIGDIAGANELTANVLLTKTTGGFAAGSGIEQKSMKFSVNKANTELWNTKQYYPVDDSPVFLCGLHPAGFTWTAGATAVYTFDGKTDVMAAPEVETKKSDAQAKPSQYKELVFRHLLTNLIIKAEADLTEANVTAAQVQEAWGAITSIELVKVQGAAEKRMNKVTVTLKDATAATATAFSLDATYAVGFYKMSGKNFPTTGTTPADPFVFTDDAFASTPIPDPAAAVAYSIIAPVTAAGMNDFTLLVKTENATAGVEVPVKLLTTGDTQGKYCIVTLKFKNTTISATASVAAWADGGTATETIK